MCGRKGSLDVVFSNRRDALRQHDLGETTPHVLRWADLVDHEQHCNPVTIVAAAPCGTGRPCGRDNPCRRKRPPATASLGRHLRPANGTSTARLSTAAQCSVSVEQEFPVFVARRSAAGEYPYYSCSGRFIGIRVSNAFGSRIFRPATVNAMREPATEQRQIIGCCKNRDKIDLSYWTCPF